MFIKAPKRFNKIGGTIKNFIIKNSTVVIKKFIRKLFLIKRNSKEMKFTKTNKNRVH